MTAADARPWNLPETFDEYRLVRSLGRGGMGEVFLADDTLLQRPVAVKFLSALEPDARAKDRFLIEARAVARLSHPNVLTIYRVGELAGRPFLVTEFIRGENLKNTQKPLGWRRVLELAIGLSRGLAAAHRRGVLHRDIKPANVIIAEDGTVKLLDFGLAKLVENKDRSIPPPPMPPANLSFEAGEPVPQSALAWWQPARRRSRRSPESRARPYANGDTLKNIERRGGSTPPVAGSTPPTAGPAPGPGAFPSAPPPPSEVRGTPGYMAPEIWYGQPATRRSDVYSLGVLLFELCTGKLPNEGLDRGELFRFLRTGAPRVGDVAPSVEPRLAAIIDRCLKNDPTERFASAEELLDELERMGASRRDSIPEGNPYRGLQPFEAQHRDLFFGRGIEVQAILERLRIDPCVLVAGDSGVGKSSLCRAGVLPRVIEGALGDGREWAVITVVPGRRPFEALSAALAPVLGVDEAEILDRLHGAPSTLDRGLPSTEGILLFIDHLEEMVTMSDGEEAELAGELLGQLAGGVPGVRLLMTVRSDFLGRVASLPGIGDEVSRSLYLLRSLSAVQIREAIMGPAKAKGASFESTELVGTLIESTARTEGGLPLLQFALAELWEARDKVSNTITADALERIGGVDGALARHADEVYLSLSAEQRAAAKRILMALVHLDGTRARRAEDELVAGSAHALAALDALIRGRLVVARETDDGPAFDLAHEALLKGWSTLGHWLEEHSEGRAVKHRLETAAAEWQRLGRAPEALWSQRQLDETSLLDPSELSALELSFLKASRGASRRHRLAKWAFLVAVPAAILLAFGVSRLSARLSIDREIDARLSAAERLLDDAREKNAALDTLRRDAFAAFDASAWDRGEDLWSSALAATAEVDKAYGHAGQALEAALALDQGRADVRARLGDTLYERALAAELAHHGAQRDDLLERLALYDESGERRRKWDAPARLSIESQPPGARVTIAQFVEDASKRRALGEARALGQTPIAAIEIPRGSYVLTFSAEGRVALRYPVLLGRGEEMRIALDLPSEREIPKGFLYIPPGRFLFGSAADEALRHDFLSAAPQHEVETGGYLIAQHETTFRDFIAYLRALPEGERARRAPKVGKAGLVGGLELSLRDEGEFELVLYPTSNVYRARMGETITYASRDRRATQDWLSFPVSGISLDDAKAYAAWLDQTGRVPGARLCTEREWERAARGADDREYPNGDRLAPEDANYDVTYGKHLAAMGPDEVGSHPASQSPFGAFDMAGNVFEWTLSPHGALARGGAYYYDPLTCRSTNRNIPDPTMRDPTLGMRVCASFPRR